MAFTADRRRLLAGLLAVVSTALLAWFGTGLTPFWPLLWLAPLPVLLFAGRASWWGAALVAALAWFLGGLNLWHYFHAVLRVPPFVLVAIYATPSATFALAVLLQRALLRRGAYVSALLAFPAAWVSFEYLLNVTSPHATGGNIAYSQLEFLPFLQLASLTGPWGMSFLLLMFSSAIAVGLHLRATAPRHALRLVAAALGVIVLALIFGAVRLALPAAGKPVKVGLLASDSPASPEVSDEGEPTTKLFQAYAGQAAQLAARGAQAIVMPEKIGVVVDPDTGASDAIFQSLADRIHAVVVVGLIHVAPPVKYNQARVYAPGAPVLSYDKEHMLPPFESKFKPGTALTLTSTPAGTWGVAICKDMDFTPLSRRYGAAGAGLMLVPAWDFNLDRWSHGHMAVMRGVESGFAVVRSAKNGYLTVSDDRGRIVSETTSNSAPFAALLADVPAAHDQTLYLLAGDWFAWVALLLLAFAVVRCARPRRRARVSPD
ncbi:MAG TPA: nitrilase-related carbon-nitrogen hydrolase [Thermoanaerobaculia bacterium]|nr:nitrilase-related carbon-nitrogen hydrolase [Thermoanaerobaculia bacterium]